VSHGCGAFSEKNKIVEKLKNHKGKYKENLNLEMLL